MERGYVKLWRAIDQNALLENDNNSYVVFGKLLTRVNRHTGAYTTGRNKFSAICNMKPSTLYGVLQRLESSTIIRQESNTNSTTIYLCNWATYQQDDDRSSNVARRQPVTIQEKKEKKKENNNKRKNKEMSLVKKDDFDIAYEALNGFWSDLIGRKLSDNKTSRKALKDLLKDHDAEEIQYAIRGAVYFKGKQYKPQVMSFASMLEKWDNLMTHMESEKQKGVQNESNKFA